MHVLHVIVSLEVGNNLFPIILENKKKEGHFVLPFFIYKRNNKC